MATTKITYTALSLKGRKIETFTAKKTAIEFAKTNPEVNRVKTSAGDIIWRAPKPEPVKAPVDPATGRRVYTRAPRATASRDTALTGRFDLAEYDTTAGATNYARRPDATLRAILGIKWVELWDLGISIKVARGLLADLDAGRTTVAEIIAPLGIEA